jgi:glycogen debranching enzyme
MAKIQMPLPKLLSGEKIISVKEFNEPFPADFPTSLRELERLSRAKNHQEIGKSGPVIASEPLPSHMHEPAFRRYEALFGRDALRVSLDLLDQYPKLARTTLLKLAELQGVEVNAAREEEPGRIVHENRDPKLDPIARELTKEKGWGWPYYGSVDSTPEYIRTLIAYCRSSKQRMSFLHDGYKGRDNIMHTMADSLTAAVDWLLKRLDANKEGLLEFKRSNPKGIENQVWKDSWDAYFHSDGTMANHTDGIASIEVQRVVHDALLDAADFYEKYLDKAKAAQTLKDRAANLCSQIMNRFWSEKHGGFFVLGTDRNGQGALRQLAVRTSNMGHMLHSPLLGSNNSDTADRREAIISQLFSPEMFGINGIMTLASNEIRYRPGAYHDGSVWSWDNYFIAQGLRMHGYEGLADFVESVLLDGIMYSRRFVEYLRGGNDRTNRINTQIVDVWDETNGRVNRLEQPPQDMQAWTAAAVLAIKHRREHQPVSSMATEPHKRDLEKRLLKRLTEALSA